MGSQIIALSIFRKADYTRHASIWLNVATIREFLIEEVSRRVRHYSLKVILIIAFQLYLFSVFFTSD